MTEFHLTRGDTITIWPAKAKTEAEAIAAFVHCFGGDWFAVPRPWTECVRTYPPLCA